jgi:uncharacterized damage-inducible protein DinB
MPLKLQRLAGIVIAFAATAAPMLAQMDVKATVLKHLKVSREFTLKVADQMPEASYNFKLTPPQMSFAEQMAHLAGSLTVFVSPFSGAQPSQAKPASMNKKDVVAFVGKSYDDAIQVVSKLTPEQISKSYKSEEGNSTGLELLMMMMDHCTHHRASAEMYLRAKGITPTEYQF